MIFILFTIQTISSDALIESAIKQYADLLDLPAFAFTIERDAGKKPHLKHTASHPIDFSLSHSGGCVAVAVSEYPIGLDIEHRRPLDCSAISQRIFDREIKEPSEFFEEWTKRESTLKKYGFGFPKQMKEMPDARCIPFIAGYTAAVSGTGGIVLTEYFCHE